MRSDPRRPLATLLTVGAIGCPILPVTLAECRYVLAWMRDADVIPLEVAQGLVGLYLAQLDTPSNVYVVGTSLLGGRPERLFLRALLETVRHGGWPAGPIPDTWTDEPITGQLAVDAIEGFQSWRRRVPSKGLELLGVALTVHLGTEAIPPLLKLATGTPAPLYRTLQRSAGGCLVWLCYKHPEHKNAVLSAWDAATPPADDDTARNQWHYIRNAVHKALAAGDYRCW